MVNNSKYTYLLPGFSLSTFILTSSAATSVLISRENLQSFALERIECCY